MSKPSWMTAEEWELREYIAYWGDRLPKMQGKLDQAKAALAEIRRIDETETEQTTKQPGSCRNG